MLLSQVLFGCSLLSKWNKAVKTQTWKFWMNEVFRLHEVHITWMTSQKSQLKDKINSLHHTLSNGNGLGISRNVAQLLLCRIYSVCYRPASCKILACCDPLTWFLITSSLEAPILSIWPAVLAKFLKVWLGTSETSSSIAQVLTLGIVCFSKKGSTQSLNLSSIQPWATGLWQTRFDIHSKNWSGLLSHTYR